ncbi:MAG: DUF927 domain-containing protein [bacterium]|nr:DUF927 domain-containing protein [bacterium]
MYFKFKLSKSEDSPYIESVINNNNVYIKLIDKDKILYDYKYPLGFWKMGVGKMNGLVELVKSLGVVKGKTESELLVLASINEYRSIFDLKKIPFGFDVDGGLYTLSEDRDGNTTRKLITHTPVWVPFQYYNCDTNHMMIDLAFYSHGKLCIVPSYQKDAFQRRGIMEVASHGALLEEGKAGQLINWLTNYIHYNDIPLNHVFERFGWKDDMCFVLGTRMLSDVETKNIKIMQVPDKSIQGLECNGTAAEWVSYTKKILKYDRARIKCYAACAAPLLKLVNQKSFVVHDYGDSSTGKTKTSELAMSIWGDPGKLIMSGFGTAVGKERLATIFTDLPIFIDETSTTNEDDTKNFIYLIANETGKLRGLKEGGLQDTANWKTIAFTTGEEPLINDNSFTGMAMRTIELFGGLGVYDKEAIDEFKIGVESCYGVLGEYIIHKIIDNEKELQQYYTELTKKFNDLATELNISLNGIGGRSASMFAVIALGGLIFEEVVGMCGGEQKEAPVICADVYREYINIMSEAKYSMKAYEYFMSWFHTKEKYFLVDMMEITGKTPYDIYGNVTDTYIDIFPNMLKEVLERGGFNYRRVIKDWVDEKIIIQYEDKNGKKFTNYVVKYYNKTKKVIRVGVRND